MHAGGGPFAALLVLGLLGVDLVDPTIAPEFPSSLPAGTPAVLTATVADASGVSSATLVLERGGELPQAFVMQPSGANRWAATVPAQNAGTSTAVVSATDGAGRTASSAPTRIVFVSPKPTTLEASSSPLTLLPLPLPEPDGGDESGGGTGGEGPGAGPLDSIGGGGSGGPAGAEDADRQAPTFTLLSPADGSQTAEARPTLRVSYQDASGIDVASASMAIDGAPLRPAATAAGAVAVLYRDLAPGDHVVEASVADAAGNVARATWRFSVDDGRAPGPLADVSGAALTLDGLPSDALRLAPIRFAGGEERRPVVGPLVVARPFPDGVDVVGAFELAPESPGTGAATLELHASEAWLEASGIDAARLLLLHHVDGEWRPHLLEGAGAKDGVVALVTAVPSFSPFALAVDTAGPAIGLREELRGLRAGDVVAARVSLRDASGVVPGALLLDGVPVPGVSRSPERMVAALGPLDAGTHTLTARAADPLGNEAEETWTFVVGAADAAGGGAEAPPLGSPSSDASPSQGGASAADDGSERVSRALLGSLFVGIAGLAGLARALSKGREPPKRRR